MNRAKFAVLALAALACPAAAQDDPVDDPVKGPPIARHVPHGDSHPLLELRKRSMAADLLRTHRLVFDVMSAQSIASATGRIDADRDGTGEHATWSDLLTGSPTGKSDAGGEPILNEPFLAWEDTEHVDEWTLRTQNVTFRLVLPTADGTAASTRTNVDPDESERHFWVFALADARDGLPNPTVFTHDGNVLMRVFPEGTGPVDGGSVELPPADDGAWQEIAFDVDLLDVPVAADSPWRDQEAIDLLVRSACKSVTEHTGHEFGDDLPLIRLVTPDELSEILAEEMLPILTRIGMAHEARSLIPLLSASLLGKFVPATGEIVIVPRTAEVMAAFSADPDVLSSSFLHTVLVHECVHALDFRRTDIEAARTSVESASELLALGAIIEGHAQFVTQQAVTPERFQLFEDLITMSPRSIPDERMRATVESAAASMTFPYVQGLAFFHACVAERGATVIEEILADPPTDPSLIEHPEWWLDPELRPDGVDLEELVAKFTWLVIEPSSVQSLALLRDALRPQFAQVVEDGHADPIEDVLHARAGVAVGPDGVPLVMCGVIQCGSPEGAALFVRADRVASEKIDAQLLEASFVDEDGVTYTDDVGAGEELGESWTARKKLRQNGRMIQVEVRCFSVGSTAFELTISQPAANETVKPHDIDYAVQQAIQLLRE